MKPGRKKKNPVSDAAETEQGSQDELTQAKAAILQLQSQLSQSQERYLSLVKKYNKLVDDISRLIPAHIET